MYICETTAKERLIVSRAVGDTFSSLERAHRMLGKLLDDHFGNLEQKDIPAYDAENIGDLLYTIDDIIFNSVLEYALLTSDTRFGGFKPHLEGAGRAVKALRVQELNDAIFNLERRMKPEQREEVCNQRGDSLKLPDEQAAAALEELLSQVKSGVQA